MAHVVVWTSEEVKLKSTVYVSIIASAAGTLVCAAAKFPQLQTLITFPHNSGSLNCPNKFVNDHLRIKNSRFQFL
jgi:hypothetical protein